MRFASGHPVHPDETLEHLRQLKKGQHPFAIVVSCSDSRVPPELIFDQGLGDIFSIRTAGNIIGDYELGSIEYAVEHLGCKLIVVLGHENCGAIDAFLNHGHEKTNDHIQNIVDYIASEEEEKELLGHDQISLDMAVKANVLHGIHFLRASNPVLQPLIQNGDLKVVGGLYDLDSGHIDWIEETEL